MAAVATLTGIDLAYGEDRPVLTGFDLAVQAGEFLAILGPSGVGKSSLLRLIAGLLPPGRGTVTLVPPTDPAQRQTAMVFQDARLLPWRRVVGNVLFGLDGLGLDRPERLRRAHAALDLVGLARLARRWPRQLSGGQRQRVGIARALAVRPELLLMDEPFGALDPITRAGLQDELIELRDRTRATIVFVTHDIDEAVYLADRIVVLAGHPAHLIAERRLPRRPRSRALPWLKEEADILREILRATLEAGEDPEANELGSGI